MKYVPWSDEETCGQSVPELAEKYASLGGIACMRRAGHDDAHIGEANRAADADGVRHCCRVAIGLPHHDRCPLLGDA